MDKLYNFKDEESKTKDIFKKAFKKNPNKNSEKKYTIIMPPPNVTGKLHIGHALTFTIQDMLIRHNRMKGLDAKWQAGIDHAGIATQMVTEREMLKQGIKKDDLSKQQFIEKIWEQKEKSQKEIFSQFEMLGLCCDFDNAVFTMDDIPKTAVKKAFIELYNDGLIYKSKRLINFDISLKTAISDLEVINKEIKSKFFYINYKVKGSDECIQIATTRPETIFADAAIAVNPKDKRFKKYIGKTAIIPIIEKEIKIIADDYVKMEKGTGALKITPCHDFNDYEIGLRYNLDFKTVINQDGKLEGDLVPKILIGEKVLKAREMMEDILEESLYKTEDIQTTVPISERTGTVIEPYITDQWFLDTKKMAQNAIDLVKNSKIKFVPKFWENTYFKWLENIQPWCISRQIVWGHEIPVWYGEDGKIFAAEDEKKAIEDAKKHYKKDNIKLKKETDILDTWFSSSLWPLSALSWPINLQNEYYPTSVLVTGFDIIFFWVARMIMMCFYFKKQIPFKDVYVHALIKDAKGQKMSKSKGNIIDPKDMIEKHGTDALRFALVTQLSPGRDIRISEPKIKDAKHFITKIWNAARFIKMQGEFDDDFDYKTVSHDINKWAINSVIKLYNSCIECIDNYNFNVYADNIFHHFWDEFCAWQIEFSKIIIINDAKYKQETINTLYWVLEKLIILLNPITPFITETLWREVLGKKELFNTKLQALDKKCNSEMEINIKINKLKECISQIRSYKKALDIKENCNITEIGEGDFISQNKIFIEKLAKVYLTSNSNYKMKIAAKYYTIGIIADIDLKLRKEKLQKDLDKKNREKNKIESLLSNKSFIKNAPDTVIGQNKSQISSIQIEIEKMEKILNDIH